MKSQLLSEALLDIARTSKTSFIEVAEDKELIAAAQKLGIVLPSPDLAVFKTVYCEIDKVNRNGVVLERAAVEKALPTLIGKQINWEHHGAYNVCGYIIDANINEDKVEIIGAIFKSLFPEEFSFVKDKFADGALAVSFEIWNKNPETGESVIKDISTSEIAIDPIIFHGCGLLLTSKPACPNAKVYKLLANVKMTADLSEEKVFSEDLVYAELAIPIAQCANCGQCKHEKEETKVEVYELLIAEQSFDITDEDISLFENEEDEIEEAKRLKYEEKKNLSDDDFAVVLTVKNKVTGEPRKIRMFVINDEAHVRNALARLGQEKVREHLKRLGVSIESVQKKILKRAKELNMEDLLKRYEKSEEAVESIEAKKKCKTCDEDLQPNEEDICSKCKKVKKASDSEEKIEETSTQAEVKHEETVETKIEESKTEVTPEETKASVEVKPEENKEEAVAVVTTEVTQTTTDVIDEKKEVVTTTTERNVTTEHDGQETQSVVEKTEVVVTYTMEQLKDAVAQASQALEEQIKQKDSEIQTLKSELEKISQEINSIKTTKAAEKSQPELTVGNVTLDNDFYKEKQKKINRRAFGHD